MSYYGVDRNYQDYYYSVEDVKNQALYLTSVSLVLASLIVAFFVIFDIPTIIYFLAMIVEVGVIITMWLFMPKTESGRTKLLYTFVVASAIVLSWTVEYVLVIFENGAALIFGAFGITAGITLVAYYSAIQNRSDLSAMRGNLVKGLIVLIVLSIISIFIYLGSLFYLILSIFGAVLFSFWLFYDLSMIERKQIASPALAALGVYWDLLLIFKYVLNILIILFGRRD